MKREEIKNKILELSREDQELRQKGESDSDLDKAHTNKLKDIISEVGWPKISEFGSEVSEGAWLVVQHSVHDINFQKECLILIKKLASEGEFNKKLIPMLEDRILILEGKEQEFGTQFYKNEESGILEPKPIRDRKNVNERRKLFDLETLEEYSNFINESYKGINNQD